MNSYYAKLLNFFKTAPLYKLLAIGIGLVVILAAYIVLHSNATGFFGYSEPEQGTLGGNARVVSDPTASGGQAVQFIASSTPTPTPSPTPPPTGTCYPSASDCQVNWWTPRCPAYPSFPDANCTGVPAGISLTTFTGCVNGSFTVTVDTVIDSKTVDCEIRVVGAKLTLKKSKVNGQVYNDYNSGTNPNGYVIVTDSEIADGIVQEAVLSNHNLVVLGTQVHGGAEGIGCVTKCFVEDSWTHGQTLSPTADWHLSGFGDNGVETNYCGTYTDSNCHNVSLIHNRIECDKPDNTTGGGCSADLALYGDFGPITGVLFDKNYFPSVPSGYCAYGGTLSAKPFPTADHVVYTNNIWQRGPAGYCGSYGPITSFDVNGVGNVWSNNKYEDGTAIPPAL